MSSKPTLRAGIHARLHTGVVIPAHPLALNAGHKLDEDRQAALTRYYLDAGAGGVAVGVHSTQFGIRDAGMYPHVLEIAACTATEMQLEEPPIMVAGVIGQTEQAVREAELAAFHGYDLVLVGLGGLSDWSDSDLVTHVEEISKVMPVFGFYMQPGVGGRTLGYTFWREVAELEGVKAIKTAPFSRYDTQDVIRAVAESSRRDDIALYTGSDDNIIPELVTTYQFMVNGVQIEKRFVGGLLGHWGVWTRTAVRLLAACHRAVETQDGALIAQLLTIGVSVTDANAAFFDPRHDFAGRIPGIQEVLRRQGLLAGRWCLDPDEELSPGQMREIDRVYKAYPELNDDAFVAENLERWLDAGS